MNDDLILELGDEEELELEEEAEDDIGLEDGEPYFTNDYNSLLHKPSIDGVVLEGDKSLAEIASSGLILNGGNAAWRVGIDND